MSSDPPGTKAKQAEQAERQHVAEKPRRPLPLTIRGEQGLRDGEVWLVARKRLDFWSGEHQGTGKTYEMRIDLRGMGGNLDLKVKILRVQVARASGVKTGYLHHAAFKTKVPEDTERLQRVFGRMNPDHQPEGEALEGRDAGAQTRSDIPERTRSDVRERTRSDVRGERRGERDRASRRRRGPATERTQRGGSTHRSRPEPTAPAAPSGRTDRVVPQLGPGDPVSVQVHFPTIEELRADLTLDQGDATLTTAPLPSLQPMQRITLHLQLHTGQFVTLAGLVQESSQQRCVIVARRLNPSLQANLQAALGSSTGE